MIPPGMPAPAAPARPGRDPPLLTERRLGPDDLTRVIALHEAAHRAAARPGLFVRETPEFFAAHLGAQGLMLGLETSDRTLAGYCVLGLPAAEAATNFGHALGLAAPELGRVCHLDGTAVLPAWRGRGLQRWLTRRRLSLARAAGRDIALSTAAPGNVWSLANLTAEGLRVVALVPKYDGLRLMLRRDAGAPASIPHPRVPVRPVPLDGAAEEHRRLLSAGWQGVAVARSADGAALVYAPPPDGPRGRGPGS